MEPNLTINFEWLGRDAAEGPDEATFAAVEIRVGDIIATLVQDSFTKTVRPAVHVSAYQMAIWLAFNWWRLRWEPASEGSSWRLSHELTAAGGGYLWPRLQFTSDGDSVLIQGTSSSPTKTEPIRYIESFAVSVNADSFETEVLNFIEAVEERLVQVGLASEDHQLGWLRNDLIQERSNTEFAEWRRLESLMGYDCDEGPHDLLTDLEEWSSTIGRGAMEEVAAASKSDSLEILKTLWENTRRKAQRLKFANAPGSFADGIDETGTSNWEPWKRAETLGSGLRGRWGLSPGPISNEILSQLFNVPVEYITGEKDMVQAPIPAGFRNGGPDELDVVIDRKHPNSRRFALARIIGDFFNPRVEDRLFPVTDGRTARQKHQRAFAQEFLCPFKDLMDYIKSAHPTDDEIDETAEHFGVSPLLVKTTLVNKGVLDHNSLAEWT